MKSDDTAKLVGDVFLVMQRHCPSERNPGLAAMVVREGLAKRAADGSIEFHEVIAYLREFL